MRVRKPCSAAMRSVQPNTLLLRGLVLWAAVSIVAVLLRGLRWDESYEHAQVIAGLVTYPPGHPQAVYAHNALTVQSGLSALLLQCGAGAWGVALWRNALFLFATVAPPYLLTAMLCRRAWPGHLAALITLQGVFLSFDGPYPMMVWPETYTNGHIGGGFALVALALLVGGQVRAGALLFGLLPAVHVGQWPVLLGWMLCAAAWCVLRRDGATLRTGVLWSGTGLALTFAYALFHRAVLHVPIEAAVTDEARELWAAFTRYHDLHRQPPNVNGHLMIAGAFVLASLTVWSSATRTRAAGIALYVLGVAAAVWGTLALHTWLGDALPFIFQAWMPYRMINHLPACFAACVLALLMQPRALPWPALFAVAYAVTLAVLPFTLAATEGSTLHNWLDAYVAEGEAVVFALFGLAVVMGTQPLPGAFRVGCGAVLVAALAPFHQFGAACVALGLLLGAGGPAMLRRHAFPTAPRGTRLAVAALVLLVLVGHQARYRQSLPVPPFQMAVAEALADEPNAMVVTGPFPFLWQAQTGQPIFTEATTHSLVSYLPALAPRIEAMYRDVYGISLRGPGIADHRPVWRTRDAATWHALAARWQFAYVAAPVDLPLELPLRLEADGWRLYDARGTKQGDQGGTP